MMMSYFPQLKNEKLPNYPWLAEMILEFPLICPSFCLSSIRADDLVVRQKRKLRRRRRNPRGCPEQKESKSEQQ